MSTDKTGALNKRKRESERAHRAMLLWGMQDPERRSVRAAARAVNRAESTVREWRSRWEWEKRCDQNLIEITSQSVYRKLYYEEYKLRQIMQYMGWVSKEYRTSPKGIVICYHQSEKYSFATSYVKNHIGKLNDIDIYTHDFTDENPPPN